MTSIRILTNAPSDGAANLQAALRELGHNVVRVRDGDKTLNREILTLKWGAFTRQATVAGEILNNNAGPNVLNKLVCFRVLSQGSDYPVPIPEFTTDKAVAQRWERVYERHSLTGSGGEGIRVVETSAELLQDAPLYTKGLKGKRREYRIHVFQHGGIRRIFVQQKVRRQGYQENPQYDNNVRNLENGWVFAHNEIQPPRTVTVGAAISACLKLRLQWGAVDLIEMDALDGGSYVLEVNSAPGLQGGTVGFYANAVHDYIRGIQDGEIQ